MAGCATDERILRAATIPPVAVTTAYGGDASLETRAAAVAARIGAPFCDRSRSLARIRRETRAELLYVVGREREEIRRGESRLFVHAGLLGQRLRHGAAHPLIRAVAPRGAPVSRIVDATLGLAGDALHLAAVLGARVQGFEASPIVFSLLEEGLARLWQGGGIAGDAAAQIDLREGAAERGLRAGAVPEADAVVVDPMFPVRTRGPPGIDLLRAVARPEPLSSELVARALAIAPRVVLKRPHGAPPPAAFSGAERVPGRSVDYLVLTERDASAL